MRLLYRLRGNIIFIVLFVPTKNYDVLKYFLLNLSSIKLWCNDKLKTPFCFINPTDNKPFGFRVQSPHDLP